MPSQPPRLPADKAGVEKVIQAAFAELAKGAELGNEDDQAMLWRCCTGKASLEDVASLLDIGLLALEDQHF